jgi:hypothetical protein
VLLHLPKFGKDVKALAIVTQIKKLRSLVLGLCRSWTDYYKTKDGWTDVDVIINDASCYG